MAHVTIDDTLEMEIGKAGVFTIDVAGMPEPARQYIFKYGLKQCLADAHSAAKTDDERKAMTGKKLDALMRGEFRVASGRTSDPIMREAKRLAEMKIVAALAAKAAKEGKIAFDKPSKEWMKAAIDKLAPAQMEQAKANLAMGEGLDLGALGFDVE